MADYANITINHNNTNPTRRPAFQRLETDAAHAKLTDLEPRGFFIDESLPSFNAIISRTRRRMRSKQLLLLAGLLFCATTTVYLLRHPSVPLVNQVPPISTSAPEPIKAPAVPVGVHPIYHLIKDAEQDLERTKSKQSKTLGAAVKEYRRRYGIPPPPNFDKWYAFAVERGVQLIDEYDTIHDSLTPFWGIEPSTIRTRAREALGFPNSLIGFSIRDGKHAQSAGGEDWQKDATLGMMKQFIQFLPDMDLCFNIHDEPRVVVPYDDLSRLVSKARNRAMPAAKAVAQPRNSWSPRPKDINDGKRFEEVKTTRFNQFAHQPTWTHSRISCPLDSPARSLEDVVEDEVGSYELGELGFLYNQTAFSDICQSPSFSKSYGFFDRPNAFNIVHDLFPIFSQSKISSFQDIIYPSPWYWNGHVPYEKNEDYEWEKKENKIYWRGSTTGGFSRDGGWRRQHRQHFVQKINADDTALLLENKGSESDPNWTVKSVPRMDHRELMNIKFSEVGQCDPSDCDAQKEFFELTGKVHREDAWKYKYLLDIDGNAFSGRFYAFLLSKSLVYKMAVFREWHMEWLKPWAHFIPLSLKGDEWLESVRYFALEDSGKREAQRIAVQSSQWAEKVLRNEDLEVWFFRLLLE